jgi:hypothetical protein
MSRIGRAKCLSLRLWAGANAFDPSAEVPEDWPETFRADTSGCWPLFAGDNAPGFIGLYTVINALDLLVSPVRPLAPSEVDWLLDLGWRFLADRRPIQLSSSIRIETMARLAAALSFGLSRRRGRFIISSDAIISAEQSASAILERLVVARQAVIVLIGRGHFTVLRGYTPDSWLLYDCTGRLWIKRSGRGRHPWKYGFGHPRSNKIICLSAP